MDQDRALASYVRRQLYAYSAFFRRRLDAAGLGSDVTGVAALSRLPPVTLEEIGDPAAVILRPDERSIQRHAEFGLVRRVFWAKVTGRLPALNRDVLDPLYKPVHWVVQDGFPVASSSDDLDRLAELGRKWLELAGLNRSDVVVNLLPCGPNLPYWEVVLACRRAALSALHVPPGSPPDAVAAAQPTVLAGRPGDLERLLAGAVDHGVDLPGLRLLLAVGEPPDDAARGRLSALAGGRAQVSFAWAPAGVRALWAECPRGTGLHTWPDAEVVEVVDPLTRGNVRPGGDGEVVWTGIGWKGSALARLRTGVHATLDRGPCPSCRRPGPRLTVVPAEPAFARVLDSTDGVAGWQAELRTVGGVEELIVFLALAPGRARRLAPLLRTLDESLSVTQFVIESRAAVAGRVAAAGDRRVIDRREHH